MGESFRERDPTNPLDRKMERDRRLRDGLEGVEAPELDDTLDALERKYAIGKYADSDSHPGPDHEDWDDDDDDVDVSIEEAHDWGKRDGRKAVELAREEPPEDGIEVMDTKALARAMGVPAVDEPGSPARLVCSQREYMKQGIYWGPDLPLAGLISKEASQAFRSSEEAAESYWDAFELELRRSNVSIVSASHQEMYDDSATLALYVVDRTRFPIFNEKEAENYSSDEHFHVEETLIQFAFQPEKRRITERLLGRFRRSA